MVVFSRISQLTENAREGMITSLTCVLRSWRSKSVRHLSTLNDVISKRLDPELDGIRQAGTWKNERVISTSQSSHIRVQSSSDELLNFCANNYLGLANDPRVVEASKAALDKYGAGLSSVRFICGTQTIHKECKS